jgi:hypothetical protein
MLLLLVLTAGVPATQARAALEKTCAKCHAGQDADEGGFDFLFDRDALVRERFVVPGDPRASRLVQRLRKAEMPPPEAWARVAPAERQRRRAETLAALEAWIRCGAPADGFDVLKVADEVALPTGDALFREIRDDLGRVLDRPTARYFVVRPEDEAALAKTLNSLSWAPQLLHPARVSPGLVRIELAALGWSHDDWEKTLLGAYPYAVSTGSLEEETVQHATGSVLPVLRADWFIANATRPPLYHALARTPSNEAGLESALDVHVKDDVARTAVVRVGFSSSGVSQNNRLIERHTSRFGPYWRSYDFQSNVGQRNLFERPLTFVHDGGEHIWSLPNGLFGYLLTDARGNRIDRGPTAIVRDPRRPDGAVENGLSCMGCHARGFIPKTDQVGPAVRLSEASFTARERRLVALMHPQNEGSVLGLFELDTAKYAQALKELGVDGSGEEPVTRVVLAYERDVSLAQAAGELGVTGGALRRAIDRGPEAMAPLKLGGSVKRDAFTAAFPLLVQRLHLGTVRAAPQGWDAQPPARECGLGAGTIDARADDCAAVFQAKARQGAFRLVARDTGGREVWLDERRRLLWSPVQPSATQSFAAAQCGNEPLVDRLWFLPTAEQLGEALAEGLPNSGWQLLWSRDVQNGHKHDPPGIAVGTSGEHEAAQSQALPSRCVARQ